MLYKIIKTLYNILKAKSIYFFKLPVYIVNLQPCLMETDSTSKPLMDSKFSATSPLLITFTPSSPLHFSSSYKIQLASGYVLNVNGQRSKTKKIKHLIKLYSSWFTIRRSILIRIHFMAHKPVGGTVVLIAFPGLFVVGGRVEVSLVVVVVDIVVLGAIGGTFFLHTSQIRRISLNAPRMILLLSSVALLESLILFKSVMPCKLFPNNLSNTFWSSVFCFVSSFVIWTFFCKPTVAGSTTRTLGSCEIQGVQLSVRFYKYSKKLYEINFLFLNLPNHGIHDKYSTFIFIESVDPCIRTGGR